MDRSVEVDGVSIGYRVSGQGSRTLVLIHGHLAHSAWWHAVVPLLESHWRVVLLDLSGHGDSGHRETYTIRQWAADVVGVLDDLGSTDAVVAAHSLGGSVAIAVAAQHSSRISAVILFDTFVSGPNSPRPQFPERLQGRARPYETDTEARSRFRLLPPQPPLPERVLGPVVENSLHRVDGGWMWKFDRIGRPVFDYDFVFDCATTLNVPLMYVYGELSSVVTAESAADTVQWLPPSTRYVRIEGGHHHLILDHPERCAALIDGFAVIAEGGWMTDVRRTDEGTEEWAALIERYHRVGAALAVAHPPVHTMKELAVELDSVTQRLGHHFVAEQYRFAGRSLDAPGRGHPFLAPLSIDIEHTGFVSARVTFGTEYSEGARVVHGGTQPLLFDELLGVMVAKSGNGRARTASLTVDYRVVTPIEVELTAEATVDKVEGRKIFATGRLLHGDTVLCEASALFVKLRDGQP